MRRERICAVHKLKLWTCGSDTERRPGTSPRAHPPPRKHKQCGRMRLSLWRCNFWQGFLPPNIARFQFLVLFFSSFPNNLFCVGHLSVVKCACTELAHPFFRLFASRNSAEQANRFAFLLTYFTDRQKKDGGIFITPAIGLLDIALGAGGSLFFFCLDFWRFYSPSGRVCVSLQLRNSSRGANRTTCHYMMGSPLDALQR